MRLRVGRSGGPAAHGKAGREGAKERWPPSLSPAGYRWLAVGLHPLAFQGCHHGVDAFAAATPSRLRHVVISTNQFKNGTHIEVDGVVFKIMDFQHVKPGKGGAFVRTKLKRVSDGAALDKTFRAGEKFRPIRTETRKMQYL